MLQCPALISGVSHQAFGCAPGNLLVDESLRVRVSDFGLARVMHDLHTLTGGLGTFQWMAPEVLAHQRYSEKADIYSFGIVLWECTARQVSCLSSRTSWQCTQPAFHMTERRHPGACNAPYLRPWWTLPGIIVAMRRCVASQRSRETERGERSFR
jgi:serine/threonine protein kinase